MKVHSVSDPPSIFHSSCNTMSWTMPKRSLVLSVLVILIAIVDYFSQGTGDFITLPSPAMLHEVTMVTIGTTIDTVPNAKGGESIAWDGDVLVTGTEDGYLKWFSPTNLSVVKSVQCPPPSPGGGRPCRVLGMRRSDEDGALYGLDENCRLFKYCNDKFEWLIDKESWSKSGLREPGLFNDLVIHGRMIYITDSLSPDPSLHPLQRFFNFDNSGRLIGYNLETGAISIVADNLHLPNGIEISHDNSSLLVAECSFYRVIRIDLETGLVSQFLPNTFGAIDNIRKSAHGDGYWLGISATRFTRFSIPDFLASSPFLRVLLTSKTLLPLLLTLDSWLGEGAAFYKVNSRGHPTLLVRDIHKLTRSITLSTVIEDRSAVNDSDHWENSVLFVGSPFAGVFRIEIEHWGSN